MNSINPSDISLSREVLSGTAAKIVLLIVGFLGNIVFARVLGAKGFGAYYLLVALENIVDRPIVGFSVAAEKRLSESDSNEPVIFGSFLSALSVFLLIAILASAALEPWLRSYIGIDRALPLFILLLVTLSIQETFSTLLASTGRQGLVNWLDSLRSVITTPAQISFILLGLGVLGMSLGIALASIITSLLILFFIGLFPAMPTRASLQSLWEYGRYSIPSAITSFGYDKIAFLIIGYTSGTEIAGYFEASLKLTVPALLVGGVASGVLMPKVSSLMSRGEDVSRDVENVLSFTSIIAVPIVFGAASLADKIIITTYGGDFAPAAQFLVLFAVYRLIRTRSKPFVSVVKGMNRPDIDLYSTIAASAVLIVVGWPLLAEFGPSGIIVGMIGATSTRYLITSHYAQRRIGSFSHLPRPFLVQITAGATMFITIEYISSMIALDPWYRVFLLIGFGAAIYFVTLVVLSKHTRNTVLTVFEDYLP